MKLDYAAIIKQAWEIVVKNVPLIAMLMVVFIIFLFVRALILGLVGPGIIAFVLSLVILCVHVFLGVGAIKIALNLVDGKSAKIEQLWGYPQYFVHALVVVLAIAGLMLIMDLLIALGISLPLFGIISLVVAVATVYIMLRLWFALYYVVDKEMKGVDALKASWNKTKGSVLTLFIFMLILVLLIIIGALALVVGLLVAIPVCYIAFTLVYRKFQS